MWSVILPYAFYPFGVYLAYIYFSTALPLVSPVVALVGFFSFVANWTNYYLPYVMLPQSDQFPVQVGLGTLLDSVPQFNLLVVFQFSQRFLAAGMLAGSARS